MSIIQQSQSVWVDDDSYPELTQSDTFSDDSLHFWDMHETGAIPLVTDVIGGATITSSSISAGASAEYVNILANETVGNAITNGIAIGNRDFLILVVAKSVGVLNDNGHTGFYWQNGTHTFKCHPYYGLLSFSTRTLPYTPNLIRTVGSIYTHAIVRRGNIFEFYCLPRGFIDSLDILKSTVPDHAEYIDVPTVTFIGHGGYGTPANNGVGREFGFVPPWSNTGNIGQDYAGIAIYGFAKEAPSMESIVKGIRWCEAEWTTKTSGKRLYPGW